jgi:hypothetical protein
MAARPYQRVPPSSHEHESDDSDSDGEDAAHATQQQSRSQRAALWSTRLHAFMWVAAAGLVGYGTDFLRVAFTDPRVKRWAVAGCGGGDQLGV